MKKFIIVGNGNAVITKEVFPLFKDGKMRFGNNYVKEFVTHCGDLKNFGNVCWYTTFPVHREQLVLTQRYDPERYPKYDNFDAIEVSRVKNIPMDYDGIMGVPISFLGKYCPEQFEIVGLDRYVEDNPHYGHRFTINGKETYARILIRKRTA